MNDNAYKVELPRDYGVSTTFNVADLSPYYDEFQELPSLRANSFQEVGNVVAKPNNLVMDISLVQDVASCIGAMHSIHGQQDIQSLEFLVVLIN